MPTKPRAPSAPPDLAAHASVSLDPAFFAALGQPEKPPEAARKPKLERKPRPLTVVSRCQHRVTRAETRWRELLELLREPAARPGYVGPDPAAVERIAADIAEVKDKVGDWMIDMLQRHPRRYSSRLDPVIAHAVARAIASRKPC